MKTSQLTGRALDYAVALAEGHTFNKVYGKGCASFDAVIIAQVPGSWQGHSKAYILDTDATRAMVKQCEDYPFLSDQRYWLPSNGPAGDDIIDREKISTEIGHSGQWLAYLMYNLIDEKRHIVVGATRREAAMRAYVASKLGDSIEIPKELK